MGGNHFTRQLAERRKLRHKEHGDQPRRWWLLIGAPVFIGLLIGWLGPFPQQIKRQIFPSKVEPKIAVTSPEKRYENLPTSLCGWNYVSKSPPPGMHASNAKEAVELASWVQDNQLSFGEMYADAAISSSSSKVIVLMKLDIDVTKRSRKLRGGATFEVECPGHTPPSSLIIPTRYIHADLDDSPPTVRSNLPNGHRSSYSKLAPMKWPMTVTDKELEYFHIEASARNCDCSWKATLTWSTGGKVSTSAIDDDGKAFRVVGDNVKIPRLQYSSDTRKWTRCIAGNRCGPMIFNARGGLEVRK